MPSGFMNISFHTANFEKAGAARQLSPPTPSAGPFFGAETESFDSDEAAARFYLSQEMFLDERPAISTFMTIDEPAITPGLEYEGTRDEALTKTRLVKFNQSQASIPVFGSQAMVELMPNRALVAIDAQLADPTRVAEVSTLPTLSPMQALQQIAGGCGVEIATLSKVNPPSLMLFHDEDRDIWHLAYFFREVPAAPVKFLQEALAGDTHHAPDPSPRELQPLLNYLVDAHDGALLYYYSAYPMLDYMDGMPVRCRGLDIDGRLQQFFGQQVANGFELNDPLRKLKTLDMQLKNIETTVPPVQAVVNQNADFTTSNQAAISAHFNAMCVYDFYKAELKRDGVDDKGMELVSIVNCYLESSGSPHPVWRNAIWWKDRMWYGQEKDQNGNLRSTARYLDVIAHELTHGITQYTSNLVYKDQSGALNESFSDIFGVIINNWYVNGANSDVSTWNWEIAPGWRSGGLPLRDLRNPKRLGEPDHMKEYLVTLQDNGGVHTNSNIHNKAAYNVLTTVDANEQRVFDARDVAILYYLTLTRLPSMATFAKVLQVLTQVAATYYSGDTTLHQQKTSAIRIAYAAVGIQ